MKYYCIYTRRVAEKLIQRGFTIEKMGLNPRRPKLNIFYFEDTPEFQAALTEITIQQKKER